MENIKLYRKDGSFIEKRKVIFNDLKEFDKDKIIIAEKYMNNLIEKEYINNFELLEDLFLNDFNLNNLNMNYSYAAACIEQSKRIKSFLAKMGMYSYLVTCKPDKFLTKSGDELIIESHTILIHPCIYNKKLTFVVFDPGFRIKSYILFFDDSSSDEIKFFDGIYKIQKTNDVNYPYEIYTNRRIDINKNIYISDIHWKFNPYYETLNINDLYYYLFKIMYSYKLISYDSKYEKNPYVRYDVFDNLIIYSDGYEINKIFLDEIKNMKKENLKNLFSKTIKNINFDINRFIDVIKTLSFSSEKIKNEIIDKNVKKDKLKIK